MERLGWEKLGESGAKDNVRETPDDFIVTKFWGKTTIFGRPFRGLISERFLRKNRIFHWRARLRRYKIRQGIEGQNKTMTRDV